MTNEERSSLRHSSLVIRASLVIGGSLVVHSALRQATSVCTWPGKVIWITPPQLHMHLEVLFNAGIGPIITVGEPGAQGAGVTGTQGIGVSTPRAAAVAAATIGLASDWHIPN